MEEQKVKVNPDTIYLNQFIRYAQEGKFQGLNNEKLRSYGARQNFYDGIPEIFKHTKEMLKDDPVCDEYNIKVEHYIVSTGFAEVIRGTELIQYVENIWGCELIEDEKRDHINEIGFTIDNSTKTRALFEINKGVNKDEGISVNSKLSNELRRVDFRNMIYIADGPSDIPAFSVVKQNGGLTFAIYPKGDYRAMQQVDQMRATGRVDMYGEADYTPDTTAYMWITDKIRQMGQKILADEKAKIRASASDVPKHLN